MTDIKDIKSNKSKQSRNPLGFNFLDTDLLFRYVTETGKIISRKMNKLTAKQQRHITRVIKQSRNMLLMK